MYRKRWESFCRINNIIESPYEFHDLVENLTLKIDNFVLQVFGSLFLPSREQ